MSKVLETLDLQTRLGNLYETLSDNNGSSRTILERYIKEIGTRSDYHILRDVCNEMKQFDWLLPVDSFINESYKFAKDNELSFAVLNTLESIRTSKDKKSFAAAINALEEIKDLNESQLKKAVVSTMKRHSWVPGIKELVALSEHIAGTNSTIDKRFTNSRPVSPVLENVNGETIFCVGKRVYAMDETEEIRLAKNDEIDESFIKLVQLSEKFIISPSLTYSELRNKLDGNLYYKGYITRINFNYQLNRDFSIRLITEYDDFDKTVFSQPLIKWNPNPFTLFYVGGNI